MNTRYMNYINIKLSRLQDDYPNLPKNSFMLLLNNELKLMESINNRLENKERRYDTLLCNSLRLAEYNQLPSILSNLLKDVRVDI